MTKIILNNKTKILQKNNSEAEYWWILQITSEQGSPKEWNLDLPKVDGERAVGASDLCKARGCDRRSRETSSRNRKRALRVCESLRGTVCQHLRANSILAHLIICHGIYSQD